MQACVSCGATLSIGASDCAACGASVRPEAPPVGSGEQIDATLGIFRNLWRGNYGLPKTYWQFGFPGGIVVGLLFIGAVKATESAIVVLVGLLGLWAWQVVIGVAIWRAAVKYPGSKLWSVLARGVVVLGTLQLIRATAHLFGLSS
jgi:hypothetical protein